MSYLEIKNLQKKYTKDGPLVVNNMNLSIEKGEFIVFLGPSGCGKTTTIRMISGLEDISGGEILIDGEDVIGKKPKDRGVSMIFQSYAIWPHMTVFDNIAYPLKLQKVPKDEIKKRVTAAAEATDIVGLLNRTETEGCRIQGDRCKAEDLPDGRTAVQPGCKAPCVDENRAEEYPYPAEFHQHFRYS